MLAELDLFYLGQAKTFVFGIRHERLSDFNLRNRNTVSTVLRISKIYEVTALSFRAKSET